MSAAGPAPLIITTASVAPQRWRNGGGLTRELLAWPVGPDWQWRISVADITADGPFSAFPGVQRWFTVLDGEGVELDIADNLHRLRPGDAPLSFNGAATTACRLMAGHTRDLNLMLRGQPGAMNLVRHAQPWRPSAAACGLYSTGPGRCEYNAGKGDVATRLPAHALLWFDAAPACLSFHADPPSAAFFGCWLSAGAAGSA